LKSARNACMFSLLIILYAYKILGESMLLKLYDYPQLMLQDKCFDYQKQAIYGIFSGNLRGSFLL